LPKEIADILIEGRFSETLDSTPEEPRRLLLSDKTVKIDAQDERCIIFSSAKQLRILHKAERWHSDGTFKTAPKHFYQLYIVHGWVKGKMFPCVYAMLTCKKAAIYKLMIAEIRNAAWGNDILRVNSILLCVKYCFS
jgi:hypothetical protein